MYPLTLPWQKKLFVFGLKLHWETLDPWAIYPSPPAEKILLFVFGSKLYWATLDPWAIYEQLGDVPPPGGNFFVPFWIEAILGTLDPWAIYGPLGDVHPQPSRKLLFVD